MAGVAGFTVVEGEREKKEDGEGDACYFSVFPTHINSNGLAGWM